MGGFVGLQTTLFLNTEQGRVQTKAGASRGGKVFPERRTLAAKCSGVRRLGTALASTSAPSSDTRKRRASFCPVTAALWMACIPRASRVAQQAWGAGERGPCVRSGDLPASPAASLADHGGYHAPATAPLAGGRRSLLRTSSVLGPPPPNCSPHTRHGTLAGAPDKDVCLLLAHGDTDP